MLCSIAHYSFFATKKETPISFSDSIDDSAATTLRIENARGGDRDALLELLLDCQREIGAYVATQIGKTLQGSITEEDILQDAFIDAFRGIGKLQARDWPGFVGWVKKIAQNRLRDAIRKHKAQKRGGEFRRVEKARNAFQSHAAELVAELSCHESTPSRFVAKKEAIDAIQIAIAQLPEDYRDVIQLHCFERLTLQETADRMGKTFDSVRGLVQRAKDALRESLHKSTLWLSRR